MPGYEMSLIMKTLNRPELIQALRRNCLSILNRGGIIRKMENLGHKQLPFAMSKHGVHRSGSYFLVYFDSSPQMLQEVRQDLLLDTDTVRFSIFNREVAFEPPCRHGPCSFGELPNPNEEHGGWKKKVMGRVKLSRRYTMMVD